MSKILVAMSGGVDSSVVAYRLLQMGHDVEGVYMKLHEDEEYHHNNLCKLDTVCKALDISYRILDLRVQFQNEVYEYFVDSYKNGLTPNPCVVCNQKIKFGSLLDFAKENGFEKLATGHYVDIKDSLFAEAKDKSKDQSYFLGNVDPKICKDLVFPLADLIKDDIKQFASTIDFLRDISSQKESSEICFVPQTYIEVLQKHTHVDNPGTLVDSDGKEIGEHRGFMHYTIGKRKGFNVRIAHVPHYVKRIDAKNNIVEVVPKEGLAHNSFDVAQLQSYSDLDNNPLSVKIRYRSPKIPCKITQKENFCATIELQKNAYGIAPGQFAVLYSEDRVVGCGVIC